MSEALNQIMRDTEADAERQRMRLMPGRESLNAEDWREITRSEGPMPMMTRGQFREAFDPGIARTQMIAPWVRQGTRSRIDPMLDPISAHYDNSYMTDELGQPMTQNQMLQDAEPVMGDGQPVDLMGR